MNNNKNLMNSSWLFDLLRVRDKKKCKIMDTGLNDGMTSLNEKYMELRHFGFYMTILFQILH